MQVLKHEHEHEHEQKANKKKAKQRYGRFTNQKRRRY